MSLNHLMHPRNIYKNRPPDFRVLAEKYADFRSYVQFASCGKVTLDFHNPDAVRCLTEVLLQEDFGLDVVLPPDALVPRIPQRLNYLLLIQDILKVNNLNEDITGIDIGTGPSCIYPLLGVSHCGWKFCATEINEKSYEIACENVERNKMEDKISIFKGHEKEIFKEIIDAFPDVSFTFTMCNPPFFNKEECEERFQQSDVSDFKNQPGPTIPAKRRCMSATVAKQSELWIEGGEVEFVSRMITESQLYKDKIKLFTSMVGKKKSLSPLKKHLEDLKIINYASHSIYQGKTQRWILFWSFDSTLQLKSKPDNVISEIPANRKRKLR